MASIKPQLLIVDETLTGYSGHAFFYDLAVAEGSSGIFDRAVIYHRMSTLPPKGSDVSFRRLRLPPGHGTIHAAYRALKSRWPNTRRGSIPASDTPASNTAATDTPARGKMGYQMLVTYWYMAGIIVRLLLSRQPSLLMFQYVTLANFRAICRIARWLDVIGNDTIRFAIVLRYAPEKFLGGGTSNADRPPGRVVLVTDTSQLSAIYQELFADAVVATLPIPLSDAILDTALPVGVHDDQIQSMNIGFLGATRHEKGLAYLLETIHATSRMEWCSTRSVRFVIQLNEQFEAGLDEVVAELRSLGVDRPATHCEVHIVDGPLNEARYIDTLRSVDIMFLPYSSSKYQYSSSGLVPEALALSIPILCFADSWAGQQVRDAGKAGFLVGETVDDVCEFAGKIMKMIEQYDRYSASCVEFADVVRATNNGKALARHLYDHSY